MRRIMVAVSLLWLPLAACSDADDGTSEPTTAPGTADDRTVLFAEADGIRAEVADCFVVDIDGSRRYQTTVEVRNDSDVAREVAVTVVAELGRGGTSDTFEVAAGAGDAWAVTGDETTDDPVGDAVCTEFIDAVELVLDGTPG